VGWVEFFCNGSVHLERTNTPDRVQFITIKAPGLMGHVISLLCDSNLIMGNGLVNGNYLGGGLEVRMGKSNEIDEIVVRFVFGFYDPTMYFENISFFTLET
jgi:hypothetical protein